MALLNRQSSNVASLPKPVTPSREAVGIDQSGDGSIPNPATDFLSKRKALQERIDEVQDAMGALRVREAKLQAELDALIASDDAARPANADVLNIQAYLESQKQVRAQRTERLAALLAAGAKPSELVALSAPIDRAFARRQGYGGSRPQYPAVK